MLFRQNIRKILMRAMLMFLFFLHSHDRFCKRRRCFGRRFGCSSAEQELRDGERGEPGCRHRWQTGSPSELRYVIQLVSCQARVQLGQPARVSLLGLWYGFCAET